MSVLVFIRNLIIAGVLAWLGLESAHDEQEQPESAPETAISAFFAR